MATLEQVCSLVRSKNAGPFWVTVDVFFDGPENYARYAEAEALGPETFARLYGAEASLVKRFPVKSLNMVKISYPRTAPQGGEVERDMHCGQQYVRLLDLELD